MLEIVARAATGWPDAVALVIDDHRVTAAELCKAIDRMASGLDVGRGSRVGLVLGNGLEFFAALFAALRTGAVVVPLLTRAPDAERDSLLEAAKVDTVIDDSGVRRIAPAAHHTVPADTAIVLFTSGTTSRPKGVMIGHRSLAGMGRGIAEHRFGLRPTDAMWAPLPVNHVGPITLFLACLHAGARFLTMSRLDGAAGLDQIEREQATVLMPNFIAVTRKLAEDPSFVDRDLSSVRIVNSVGTVAEQRAVQAIFPGVWHTSTFGMTETCGAITITPKDDPPEIRARTVGFPMPGVQVRIADPESGASLGAAERGEILVGGFPILLGYLDDPEATSEAMTDDGFFRTGDLGELDPDGRLVYLGRLRSTIKVGGENVAPAEVEAVLAMHPAVAEVHVVGAPDERLGEVVVAFVESAEQVTADDLIAYCREHMSRFRVPRSIFFVTQWPQSETKVDVSALRAMAAGAGAQ